VIQLVNYAASTEYAFRQPNGGFPSAFASHAIETGAVEGSKDVHGIVLHVLDSDTWTLIVVAQDSRDVGVLRAVYEGVNKLDGWKEGTMPS